MFVDVCCGEIQGGDLKIGDYLKTIRDLEFRRGNPH